MSLTLKRAALVSLIAALSAVALWQGYAHLAGPREMDQRLVQVENALAMRDVYALASADASRLLSVQSRHWPGAEAWLTAAGAGIGVDLRRELRHVAAALYSDERQQLHAALVLLGRFQPDAVKQALARRYQLNPETINGRQSWRLQPLPGDEACARRAWLLDVTPDRIVIADSVLGTALLTRLDQVASGSPELVAWRAFRSQHIAAAVLWPGRATAVPDQAWMRAMSGLLTTELAGAESFSVGLAANRLWSQPVLDAEVRGRSAADVAALRERWADGADESKEIWRAGLPVLALLHDRLQFDNRDARLVVSAPVDGELAEQIERVPHELLGLALAEWRSERPPAESAGAAVTAAASLFSDNYSASQLPAYDPDTPATGPVEVVAGPFGVRVTNIALRGLVGRGADVEIEARAAPIPNLGDVMSRRLRLAVTEVTDRDGHSALQPAACGGGDHVAGFAPSVDGRSLTAKLQLHLRDDLDVAQLASAAGYVELRLPVGIERVRLDDLRPGAVVERGGARIELVRVQANGFLYRLADPGGRVLSLRALDAHGQPLVERASVSANLPLVDAVHWGVYEYNSGVAAIELVFAVREDARKYPFKLARLRPRGDADRLAAYPGGYVSYSLDRLAREIALKPPTPPRADMTVRASTGIGPFTVVLNRLHSPAGLDAELTVLSPRIPSVRGALSSLALLVQEVRLKNGRIHSRPAESPAGQRWQSRLDMAAYPGHRFLAGRAELRSGLDVAPEDVAVITGAVALRLPEGVKQLDLERLYVGDRVEDAGLVVVLAGLSRDGFVLTAQGPDERLLGVRAFNSSGRELEVRVLEVSDAGGGWVGRFGVDGNLGRIAVVVASGLQQALYPYTLTLTGTSATPR